MARIDTYTQTAEPAADDLIPIDGPTNGTRTLLAAKLARQVAAYPANSAAAGNPGDYAVSADEVAIFVGNIGSPPLALFDRQCPVKTEVRSQRSEVSRSKKLTNSQS